MSPPLPPVLHVADTDSRIKHFPPICTRKFENIRLFLKKLSIIIRIKNTNLPTWVAGSVRLLEGPNGSLLQPSGRQNSSESPNLVPGKFISFPPLFAIHSNPLFTTK